MCSGSASMMVASDALWRQRPARASQWWCMSFHVNQECPKVMNYSTNAVFSGPNDIMTWASNQIRKIAGCACAGNAGNVFPRHRLQRKPLVSDHGMHHGTCVTHVPCCMSGSLTRGGGENVPGIPGACTTSNITYLARGPWKRFPHYWSYVWGINRWIPSYTANNVEPWFCGVCMN